MTSVVVVLWLSLAGRPLEAEDVLVVRIGALGNAPQLAATALGHTVTVASSETEFLNAIFSPNGTLVVFDLLMLDMPVGNLGDDAAQVVVDVIGVGTKVILSYAELDSNGPDGAVLRPGFGLQGVSTIGSPLDIMPLAHPTSSVPHVLPNTIFWQTDPHSDDGDILIPVANTTVPALFSVPGGPAAAIVISSNDQTICNGFVYDSYDALVMQQLLENEITFLLGANPPTGPTWIRGDCNADGARNVADVVFLLGTVFPSGPPVTPSCRDACDSNDDGSINIADAVTALAALFGVPATPLPDPNACGLDPTVGDPLDCVTFSACP